MIVFHIILYIYWEDCFLFLYSLDFEYVDFQELLTDC